MNKETNDLPAINVPTINEIYEASENLETAFLQESLNYRLNQKPLKSWVRQHPYIKKDVINEQGQKIKVGIDYIPISIVEYLLKKIFRSYKIEITGQGTSFNGVFVTVRVHYKNPVDNEWLFHDGIGAIQLQTAKGTSPADLVNINQGAISMAFPIAKTLAIKDACDMFGSLFGADLNRNDFINYTIDASLDKDSQLAQIKQLYELKKEHVHPDEQVNIERIINNKEVRSYKKVKTLLSKL